MTIITIIDLIIRHVNGSVHLSPKWEVAWGITFLLPLCCHYAGPFQ